MTPSAWPHSSSSSGDIHSRHVAHSTQAVAEGGFGVDKVAKETVSRPRGREGFHAIARCAAVSTARAPHAVGGFNEYELSLSLPTKGRPRHARPLALTSRRAAALKHAGFSRWFSFATAHAPEQYAYPV